MKKQSAPWKCLEPPKKFSGLSKIVSIKREDHKEGIIFPDLDEVENALILYDSGEIPSGDVAHKELYKAFAIKEGVDPEKYVKPKLRHREKRRLPRMIQDLDSFLETGELDLVHKLIFDMKSSIKEHGMYNSGDIGYGGIGTAFFKTFIEVMKVEDKYVFKLNAAYVGDEPEIEIAKAMKKQRAVYSSNIDIKFDNVDEWWFNTDLTKTLKGVPIARGGLETLAKSLSDKAHDPMMREISVPFEYNGKKFSLAPQLHSFGVISVELPNNQFEWRNFMRCNGTRISGPGWDDSSRRNPEQRPLYHARLVLKVRHTYQDHDYMGPPLANRSEIGKIQKARDYLFDIISKHNL